MTTPRIDPETRAFVYPDGQSEFTRDQIDRMRIGCPDCGSPVRVACVPNESLAQMSGELFQLSTWRCPNGCQ